MIRLLHSGQRIYPGSEYNRIKHGLAGPWSPSPNHLSTVEAAYLIPQSRLHSVYYARGTHRTHYSLCYLREGNDKNFRRSNVNENGYSYHRSFFSILNGSLLEFFHVTVFESDGLYNAC